MHIAPLQESDYADWLPLWQANMEQSASDALTAETWRRLCDPQSVVGGLCARETESGSMTGICHYILHPTTGNIRPVCYMQDLYVGDTYRRRGIAKKLVTYLAAMGTAQKWARLYWLAEGKNAAAQNLYRSLGLKLDFTLHVLPLG